MFHEIYPRRLTNHYEELPARPDDMVFIMNGKGRKDDLVVMRRLDDTEITFPTVKETEAAVPGAGDSLRYLFSIDDLRFFLLERIVPETIPEGCTWEILRSVRGYSPRYLCFAATVAYHLFNWNRINRYCGVCSHEMQHDHKLRCFICPDCGNMVFPKIQPAVIIGVTKGDSICTSRYAGRTGVGRALIAGFCENGETAEETVAREVMEEIGLKVKNIRYYKSQPWGFESDLLLGYYCEVDGDAEITLDEEELASAEFVKRSELEEQKNLNSLTATMLEAFRRGEA